MSQQPSPETIPEPIRNLLAAISETLTLPTPAITVEDLSKYEAAVDERTHLIQLAIRDVLADDTRGPQWEADYLRHAAKPVRYRTPDQWLADLKQDAADGTGDQDGPVATA
ncbi:hypothetical protein GCM10010372_30790 [Streptomyces tauricus]|uniref:hypothetical protein n=1 Tax=Streptomyces tauricus TaxID=68274 RepID=UPI001671AF62|nr:hypothetical protein [Streptomyces tauricus]GHA28796.1 hypothetical protein GCM10010372_30790 [Streptomyces tauricus]